MENRLQNPLYSEVHSEVIHSPQAMRQPPTEDGGVKEKENQEDKKARTRIPISKFKQTVEKVKKQRRNNHDHKQQSQQSSVPRFKDNSLIHAHESKKPKEDLDNGNHTTKVTISNAVETDSKNIKDNNNIQNGNNNVVPKNSYKENLGTEQSNKGLNHTGIPLLVKRNVQKFRDNKKKSNQKGDSNINEHEKDLMAGDKNDTRNEVLIANNDDEGKSNLTSEVANDFDKDEVYNIEGKNDKINAEELQVIEDFDKIYEDIIDNEEPDLIIDEIVEEIKVDPEKLETKFEEIIHEYDENKTHSSNVTEVKSKIPLLKQKSLHELPVSKIIERRLSLKDGIPMNDKRHKNPHTNEDLDKNKKHRAVNVESDLEKGDIQIENSKPIKKDNMPNTPTVQNKANTVKEIVKEAVSVVNEIKTVDNIETVEYDNKIIITEEIKQAKVDEKLHKKPNKEKVKVVKPVFDEIKTVNKIDVVEYDNINIVAEEIKQINTDSKPIKEILKAGSVVVDVKTKNNNKAVSVVNEIKTVDNIEIVDYDNIIIITEEIKQAKVDEKPVKEPIEEKVKVVSPVLDEIKTVNKTDIVEYDNNIIVAEEIKQINTDSKPIKKISKEGSKVDDIKTANNLETVENINNMIVTEEIKLINTNKPKNNSTDKNKDDISSKVPDSAKMVQNLLSQMGNKNKKDIIELPTQNKKIEDILAKENDKVFNKEKDNIDGKCESKINKLINKIKSKDENIKKDNHELPDDMPVKVSIKSKISVFNKDKTVKEVKPAKNILPSQTSELKTKEVIKIPVDDVAETLHSNNGNNSEVNIQEITNNNHYKNKHDMNSYVTDQKDFFDKQIKQKDYNKPVQANVSNNDERDAQKDFNQPTIEEPSNNLDENDNQLTEDNDEISELQNDIEDYIPKGKVSSIINKIGSNETYKETPKAEVVIELPKKKSVLSRIALFERQTSKELAKPNTLIDTKSKEIAKPVNHASKIVNEIEKLHIKEDFNDIDQKTINKELSKDTKPIIIDTPIKTKSDLEQISKADTNKAKANSASKIIAKFEKKVEDRHAIRNNDINFAPINKKQTKEILQKVEDKHEKDCVSDKKADSIKKSNEEKPNLDNKELVSTENTVERRSPSLSSTEIELGDTIRGKVLEMIVRMNSKENLYQDVERKELINIKEMPRKKTVSEKVALFEKKITPVSMVEQDLAKPAEILSTKPSKINSYPKIKREMKEQVSCSDNTTIETSTSSQSALHSPFQKKECTEEDRRIEELRNAKRRYGYFQDMPFIKLYNGENIPVLSVGTNMENSPLLPHIIEAAIDLGYRAFDTAYIYGNEKTVGAAIRAKIDDGTVKREELFITNKLWSTFHRTDLVEEACLNSLQAMGLDYFDLYLIHNPMSFKEGGNPLPKIANVMQYSASDYMDAWYGMEDLVHKGLTKSIGLSNFNATQVIKVCDKSIIKPAVVQVECHPYQTQYHLEDVCSDRQIKLSCYGVLGSKSSSHQIAVLEDPLLIAMAGGLKLTVAQLLIRYQIDRGHNAVVKASTAAQLWENLQSLSYELNDTHLTAIDALNRNKRSYTFQGMGDTHRNYPFKV